MKIFTAFLLAFLSFQSFCPMQMGMDMMEHEESPMTQEDCPTAHCISHENQEDDVLLSFNLPSLPALSQMAAPLVVFPNPVFDVPPFHSPPLLFSSTRNIVLRI